MQAMTCAVALGMPLATSGVVSANNAPTTISYNQKQTQIKFNPQDELTKNALSTVEKGSIKSVSLITKKDNSNKTAIQNMERQKDGSYMTTLKGNQKGTHYSFAVTYDNGKTYKINDPYAKNAKNIDYSVVSNENEQKEIKNHITITTPDGTKIEINGENDGNTSVVSSSKDDQSNLASSVTSSHIESSSIAESSSNNEKDSSIENDKSSSGEENHAPVIDSSVSISSSSNKSDDSDQQGDDKSTADNENHAPVTQEDGSTSNDNNQKDDEQNNTAPVTQTANKKADNDKTTGDVGKQTNDANTNKNNAAVNDNNAKSSSSNLSSTNSDNQSVNNGSSSAIGENGGEMPQTGEKIIAGISAIGVALLVAVGGYYIYRKRQSKNK